MPKDKTLDEKYKDIGFPIEAEDVKLLMNDKTESLHNPGNPGHMGCLPRSACLGSRCLTHHKDLWIPLWEIIVDLELPSVVRSLQSLVLDAIHITLKFGPLAVEKAQSAVCWHESPQFLDKPVVKASYRWWEGPEETRVKESFLACEGLHMNSPVGPLWQAERILKSSLPAHIAMIQL
ncbi:hypothetical protein Tco_0748842 [Tanacetum coccineum]|uniref:Uncharacterized protein n=1 Tax=Tanacetum coccineum TaxID=301880 RepID=A0ABQ4YXX7_9ASTR